MWELVIYTDNEKSYRQVTLKDSFEECLEEKHRLGKGVMLPIISSLNLAEDMLKLAIQANNLELRIVNRSNDLLGKCFCVIYGDGRRRKECFYCNEQVCWILDQGPC